MIHAIVDHVRDVSSTNFIHVRNKNLDARELIQLVRWYVEKGNQVLVNTRIDVALAAQAAGVHLPSNSLRPSTVRRMVPEGFLIGVSCHSREDLIQAQNEGADYAYLSPVFAPLSKKEDGPILGIDGFRQSIEGLTIPVLALGGITPERIPDCLSAGAYGVAGISLVDLLQAPHTHRIASL